MCLTNWLREFMLPVSHAHAHKHIRFGPTGVLGGARYAPPEVDVAEPQPQKFSVTFSLE